MNTNTCPICDSNEIYYTECNHGHCISCLSKIHRCSLCRSPLVRNKLCTELKDKYPQWSEPEPIPYIYTGPRLAYLLLDHTQLLELLDLHNNW